ncbi:hypothetical protein [Sphaerotilus sp.]|uniref:hypothetical protein n=1 Tax=Sphaerotilus sp. TaxID=2093942 RepID=UPI0034E2481B
MITFLRTASIASGKVGSALGFAHEISGYIKSHFGVEVTVHMPIGGNPNRVAWSASYGSLAAFEAMQVRMMSDKDYMGMVAKGSENFIAGSVQDTLWRTV